MKFFSCIISLFLLCLLFNGYEGSLPETRKLMRLHHLESLYENSQFRLSVRDATNTTATNTTAPFCPTTKCLALGGTCTSDWTQPCEQCTAAYKFCSQNWTTSSNGTEVCPCFTSALACFNANPQCWTQQNNLVDTCNLTNANYALNCTCGFAVTQPTSKSICNSNLYCDQTGGTCKSKKTSGLCDGAHLSINECGNPSAATGRIYTCNNATGTFNCLASAGWALPGDLCSTSFDCYGAAGQCSGGICTGFSEGQNCLDSKQCSAGLYCASNLTCTRQGKVGALCDPANNEGCAGGYVCNLNGTCVPIFSAPNGAKCNRYVEYECSYGLICPNIDNATCQLPPADKTCITNADCADRGTTCGCSRSGVAQCNPTAAAIPSNCAAFVNSAFSCLVSSGCKTLSDDPSSCTMKYCPYTTGCLFNCLYGAIQTRVAPYNCQTYPTYTCVTPTTGNPFTLLTGSPLPTLPKPYASGASVISQWLALLVVFFVLW